MSLKLDDVSNARIIQTLEQQQVDQQLLQESSVSVRSGRSTAQQVSVPNTAPNRLGLTQPSCKLGAQIILSGL